MERDKHFLASIETQDNGKPFAEALFDVTISIMTLQFKLQLPQGSLLVIWVWATAVSGVGQQSDAWVSTSDTDHATATAGGAHAEQEWGEYQVYVLLLDMSLAISYTVQWSESND